MSLKWLICSEERGNFFGNLGRIFDGILKASAYCAGLIIAGMMGSVSYEVIMRYVFNLPTKWATDIVCLMGPYISLLPAAYVLKERGHIGMEYVVQQLTIKGQAFMISLTSLIGFLICALLCWECWVLLLLDYREGTYVYGAMVFPKYIIYLPAVIGIFLFGIQFAREFVRAIQKLSTISKKGS